MQDQVYTFSLVFIVVLLSTFKGTSGLTIYQTPSVRVIEGGTVIMNCTLSHESIGAVRWYKGENQQQLLYSQLTSEKSDVRLNRTINEGPTRDTDNSITFKNIIWEDAGMYYCVKFKSDKVTVAESGPGTQLLVIREPSPLISGPEEQVLLNTPVMFSCTSAGFYPEQISVNWLQNGMKLQETEPDVHYNSGSKTYEVQSNITVLAKIDSPVTCSINHTTLKQPRISSFNMNNFIKAIPSTPIISYHKTEDGKGTLSCTSSGFYPENADVVWTIYGNQIKELQKSISKTEDGTYNVTSTINVQVKDSIVSGVICEITHLAAMVKSREFNLKQDISGGLAITITGALRCILAFVHLGVIIFLCYLEMKNRTSWKK